MLKFALQKPMSSQNKVIKKNDFGGKFFKHLENKSSPQNTLKTFI
jgi:2-succinyl-5-enolpyruvyl-6-hydroxy-3-cyclohexene-1-carboxylate synthase